MGLRRIALTVLSIVLASSLFAAPVPGAISVRDFGAKGDGATDDTAAFQAALNVGGRAGEPVYAPAGRYRFAGHLRVPEGVTLIGTWQGPPAREKGTVLEPTEGRGQEEGTPFITLEGAAGVRGLVITYPQQVNLEPPPVPYPWTIRGLAQDCQVQDCLLVRPWQAIDFGTYPCSRHFISGVYGSPLRRGIYIDGSIDVGRITDVHFSTFFFPYEGPLDRWKLEHGEAFIIGRADWEWITNCFAIGYSVGFRFIHGKGGNGGEAGVASYVAIAHSGIDMSGASMVVEEASGITVSQSVFKGRAIEIRATNTAPVKFRGCWLSPVPGTRSLVTAGGTGRVSFDDCTFEFWDTLGDGSPALRADCASVSVQGCEFGTHNRPSFMLGGKVKRQIQIGECVKSGAISGNRFRFGQNLLNASHGDVRIEGNVTDQADLDIYGGKR